MYQWSIHHMVGAMLDIRRLKYFAAVARHGSMAAAARELNVAQPALSHHTAELERIVGFQLFERLPRGVKLTEGGRLLLDHALPILEQVSQAEQALKTYLKPAQGLETLRLGLLPSWSVGYGEEIRRRFAQTFPDLKLQVLELRNDEAARMVASDELDIATVLTPGADAEFAESIADEQLYVIANSPLPPSFAVTDLASLQLILTTRQHPARVAIEQAAAANAVSLNVVMEIDGQTTLTNAVVQGIARSIMPINGVRAHIEAGRLFASPIIKPRLMRSVFMHRAPGTGTELALEFFSLLRSAVLAGRDAKHQ